MQFELSLSMNLIQVVDMPIIHIMGQQNIIDHY